jgi:hypothetical protein
MEPSGRNRWQPVANSAPSSASSHREICAEAGGFTGLAASSRCARPAAGTSDTCSPRARARPHRRQELGPPAGQGDPRGPRRDRSGPAPLRSLHRPTARRQCRQYVVRGHNRRRVRQLLRLTPEITSTDCKGFDLAGVWSLYGAPWLQPVANGGKCRGARNRENTRKALPWIATGCARSSMVRVHPL